MKINYAEKTIDFEVVYCGPTLAGKAAILEQIASGSPDAPIYTVDTEGDPATVILVRHFEDSKLRGFKVGVQIKSLPDPLTYVVSRRLVLRGCDGVILVLRGNADSREENKNYAQALAADLDHVGLYRGHLPIAIHFIGLSPHLVEHGEEISAILNTNVCRLFETEEAAGVAAGDSLRGMLLTLQHRFGRDSLGSFNVQYGIPLIRKLAYQCNSELIRWLALHPEDLYQIHPGTFERIIAEIFEDEGFQVEVISSWNQSDGGVDLIAAKKVSGAVDIRLAIQCKRFQEKRKVSADIIRSLAGVLDRFQAHAGVVATTSTFSRQAVEEVRQTFWRITLRDHARIVQDLRNFGVFRKTDSGLWLPSLALS